MYQILRVVVHCVTLSVHDISLITRVQPELLGTRACWLDRTKVPRNLNGTCLGTRANLVEKHQMWKFRIRVNLYTEEWANQQVLQESKPYPVLLNTFICRSGSSVCKFSQVMQKLNFKHYNKIFFYNNAVWRSFLIQLLCFLYIIFYFLLNKNEEVFIFALIILHREFNVNLTKDVFTRQVMKIFCLILLFLYVHEVGSYYYKVSLNCSLMLKHCELMLVCLYWESKFVHAHL